MTEPKKRRRNAEAQARAESRRQQGTTHLRVSRDVYADLMAMAGEDGTTGRDLLERLITAERARRDKRAAKRDKAN